jgi:DNA polymerase-3 subunit gamma/tau
VAASLYRRHRPRTFADVVGQEHVVRTLSNAIGQDRVHHAYLFVGSRGTGKTSMAKILAASLNCQGEAGGGTGPGGPTITPCGTCESCRSIATATSLDVVEMDAASNNSVDDIRDLRERVGYAPVAGGYKVYILDEAHMLTPAAWNAFLKTLEEPPPHTIFVLATTEANKVLPTVVDRCHRFDFGRPSVVQIASVLRRAADSESIEIPDEAIALVARSATGSFRDALGTLEQLLAYSGSSIVLDDVLAVLGAADADLLFGTLDAVSAGDARSALLAAARLADSGRDLGRFFADLEAHARSLLVTQVLGAVPAELSVTPDQDERLAEQAKRVGGAEIVRLLELIAFALRAMKDGADPRTQLELALVKAAKPDLEPTVKALQARIARLESAPPPPALPRTPDRPQTPAGRAALPATPIPPAPPLETVAIPDAQAERDIAPNGRGRTDVHISAQVDGQPPIEVSATLPGAGHATAGEAQRAADHAAAAVSQALATEADPAPAVTATATVDPEAAAPAPSLELSLDRLGESWPAILAELREGTPMLAAALDDCAPAALTEDGLTLAWPETSSFLKRKAEDPANRDLLVRAIRSVTGSSLRLAYELRSEGDPPPTLATMATSAPKLTEDDLVQRFMEEFDAEELPPDPEEQT